MMRMFALAATLTASASAMPTVVWPHEMKESLDLGANIPEPVPNFPRSYTSNAKVYLVVPGRGNVTMEGVVMCDGVIGYERTSFMEVAYSQRNPDAPNVFPETQIKNENRGTLTHLRQGTMPGQSIACTVDVLPPPPPPALSSDPDPSINYQFMGYGFIDYHVAAVFQLNDGQQLTTGLYQDAFTQQPLAIVNLVQIPGRDGRTENVAVFGENFAPVAPPGENFIVPEGIDCNPRDSTGSSAGDNMADAVSEAMQAFPFLELTKLAMDKK